MNTEDGEHIKVTIPSNKKKEYDEFIKANKPQILEILKQRKAAAEERKAKIAAIQGLQEIRDALDDMAQWREEFNKSFEGEYAVGGLGVRPKPDYDLKAMQEQYPIATAYLRAEGMANKPNYEMAAIGQKALDAIIDNPDDYKAIIEEMKSELDKFHERHMWD